MSKIRPEKVKRMTSLTALESNAIADCDRLKENIAVIHVEGPQKKEKKKKVGGRLNIRDLLSGI